jgi:flagellar basal body rod protein FlgG
MNRCSFVICGMWVSTTVLSATVDAARPPVQASKPVTTRMPVAGCDACRFLPPPSRTAPIVPVQEGPSLEAYDAAPRRREAVPDPLPPAVDATPLPSADADLELKSLIEQSLPDASDDERRVWLEELRSLPLPTARAILSARIGDDSSPGFSRSPVVPEPTDEPLPEFAPPMQSEPPLPGSLAPLQTSRPEDAAASPDVSTTLAVLRRAEAALLHNIANATTPGYKRLLPQTTEAAGAAGVAGLVVRRTGTPGTLHATGRPFDLAIDGEGFLQVRKGDTVALTRGGSFVRTASLELALEIDGERWSLYPPVYVADDVDEFVILQGGVVGYRQPDSSFVQTGQIQLARVLDSSQLEPAGGGLLAVPDRAGRAAIGIPGENGFGSVSQGCLEGSNVDLEAEIRALNDLRLQIAAFDEPVPSQLAAPADLDPRR